MTAERLCHLINLTLTAQQMADAKYLEACGYRFCIDFGYQNARDLADDHFRKELYKIDQMILGLRR
jgi:hypothetical protein